MACHCRGAEAESIKLHLDKVETYGNGQAKMIPTDAHVSRDKKRILKQRVSERPKPKGTTPMTKQINDRSSRPESPLLEGRVVDVVFRRKRHTDNH